MSVRELQVFFSAGRGEYCFELFVCITETLIVLGKGVWQEVPRLLYPSPFSVGALVMARSNQTSYVHC